MKRFRSGLVFEAHGLLYHSTLGLRVIKKQMATPHGREGEVCEVNRKCVHERRRGRERNREGGSNERERELRESEAGVVAQHFKGVGGARETKNEGGSRQRKVWQRRVQTHVTSSDVLILIHICLSR